MTGEKHSGGSGRRSLGHRRSKSNIADIGAQYMPPPLEAKDVHKASSGNGKGPGWLKSWMSQHRSEQSNWDGDSEYPNSQYFERREMADQEVEEKPQRILQGLDRDDDGGPSPKILTAAYSAARDAGNEFSKDRLAQVKADPDGRPAVEEHMRPRLGSVADAPKEVEEKPHRVLQGLYRDDDGGPSPKILMTTHSAAREALNQFSKDLLAVMKADPGGRPAVEEHMRQRLGLVADAPKFELRYLIQAYIARQLFADFENASFGMSNPGEKPWEEEHTRTCFEQFKEFKSKSQTVSALLENESNGTFLSVFCMKKFVTVIPLDAGFDFFRGGLHHEVTKGKHPDNQFYKSFLGAAVSVWLLQRLACSFEQKIVMINPIRGDEFQWRYMKPAVPGFGDNEDEEDCDLELFFTVFPGFRVSASVVKSLVYIVEKEKPSVKADSTPVEDHHPPPNLETVAAPADVRQSLNTDSSYRRKGSLPSSPFTQPDQSSAISRSTKKSVSLTRYTSDSNDHPQNGFLQKIKKTFTRKKKTPAKAKDANYHPSLPAVEEARGAPAPRASAPGAPSPGPGPGAPSRDAWVPPSTDARENTPTANSSMPGDSSFVVQPLDASSEPAPLNISADVGPLYKSVRRERLSSTTPRAQTPTQQSPLQSPMRSPGPRSSHTLKAVD